jgi:hypothetical protein
MEDRPETNATDETQDNHEEDARITALREELEASRANERTAVERLRAALMASEPALEAAMVTGETVEEVEASFAAATALLAKLRERAAAETASRVPAGAPGRLASRPKTAFEKIRDGLGKAG